MCVCVCVCLVKFRKQESKIRFFRTEVASNKRDGFYFGSPLKFIIAEKKIENYELTGDNIFMLVCRSLNVLPCGAASV